MSISLLMAVAFLAVNVLLIWLILIFSRRVEKWKPSFEERSSILDGDGAPVAKSIPASQFLGWEFEYARITASEAMHDRHTMVNYYLLIVGIAVSGMVNAISLPVALPPWLGAVLLWLLCGVGWLYFLKLIRLRQAWYDSARAMNQIKEFCILHSQEFSEAELRGAFRWQASSLPIENKPWTLFFFSAMLIAFMSTSAFFVGGLLLELTMASAWIWLVIMTVLAIVFFAAHMYFYFAFLRQR